MAEALDLVLAGEPVRLLADRALYWPARRRLLLADLHLARPTPSAPPASRCRAAAPRSTWRGCRR
jgi:hypothetical protein